ncbi:TetR/AcrR family transcriptional regulator [Cellvibrio sp. PSBB023]|uniref:TetR/AcrR family transcriptional regulator n=1 Tax=Cellvibrio sp. PSBB023 TaxID=1945512 RepID=UPI001FEEA414|nr:TetR/AcrR family transcriptional regulator [Cellvibrio sp. PSBB023]
MATKTTAVKKTIAPKNTSATSPASSGVTGVVAKATVAKKKDDTQEFNPTETPTGKYKPGKIRDRNLNNIINAAEEEFVQNGFRGASIQNIADRAGIPKANVHYYFKSKTNLYVAVLDNIINLWNDLLGEITVDDDPAEVLDRFIRKKVELSYTNPRASKLYAMEMIQGAPHLKGYIRTEMRQFVRRKAQIIEQWIEQGRMDKVDPMHLIFLIWASTQHYADFDVKILTVMNRAEYEPDMINDISDFLSQMILKGCGLKPPVK